MFMFIQSPRQKTQTHRTSPKRAPSRTNSSLKVATFGPQGPPSNQTHHLRRLAGIGTHFSPNLRGDPNPIILFFIGCGFFAYSWKRPAYNGAFLLATGSLSFSAYSFSSFAYSFSFFTYSWSFFAYGGRVHLVRALRDCKQRSLTVSKKAPSVSRKTPPFFIFYFGPRLEIGSLSGQRNCNNSKD